MAKKHSTSALAKHLDISSQQLFKLLSDAGFICRQQDKWQLLPLGEAVGGEYQTSSKYGEYIVWPDTLTLEKITEVAPTEGKAKLVTATQLGKTFSLSANKMNFVLSELGWLERALKGWKATAQGLRIGGVQKEDFKSGIPYVAWPEAVLTNPSLVNTIEELQGEGGTKPPLKPSSSCEFRSKCEAHHRATDGHYVRSRAEMLIDNWLYMAEIIHAYERHLPIEEELYCDFYLPTGKVYIEFWGMEDDPSYAARKQQKQQLYTKYGFNLIELNDDDILNLDDVLPKRLLKFGIEAY